MRTEKKKWMVQLEISQYDWIKETATKADVSGAAVLRALMTQAMELNSAEFRKSLMDTQLKMEIQTLEDKEAKIAEKKKELNAKLKGREKVLA